METLRSNSATDLVGVFIALRTRTLCRETFETGLSLCRFIVHTRALASCLINAQPLPAHRPAIDDNSLIGTRPRPDRWLVGAQYPFRWQPYPISLLVWVRSFIEPGVLKTMYRSTIPLRFIWSICSGLGFKLDSELHYFSIFHGE